MDVVTRMAAAGVTTVEAHDVKILVFDPDAPQEASHTELFLRRDVEHQAAHFAEEFAAHVIELVVLLVEAIRVDKDHLQEAVRQELHRERKEVADGAEDLLPLAVGVRQGNQRDALREVRAAEEILVAGGGVAKILIGLQVLDVRLNQRGKLLDLLVGPVFVGDHAVDDFVHGPRLIGRLGRLRNGHGPHPAQDQNENSCSYLTHFLSPLSKPNGIQFAREPGNPPAGLRVSPACTLSAALGESLLHRDRGPNHLPLGSPGCCRSTGIPYREPHHLLFSEYALPRCTPDEASPGCQQPSWGFRRSTLSSSAPRSRSDPRSRWTATCRAWRLGEDSPCRYRTQCSPPRRGFLYRRRCRCHIQAHPATRANLDD